MNIRLVLDLTVEDDTDPNELADDLFGLLVDGGWENDAVESINGLDVLL